MDPKDYPSLITRRSFIRQAACAAVGTAAITNTLRDLRLMNMAMAQGTPPTDYKALICIFLSGGNDSNNWFIPTNPTEYDQYAAIREAPLAIPLDEGTHRIRPLNGLNVENGRTFGIHPSCPELQQLFNTGKMAVVFNVGTLVYPLTKAQYTSNSVARPPQLFSHGDQVVQWQTSIPDREPINGWGGRCADYLDAFNPKDLSGNSLLSLAISVAGSNTFEVGALTQQYSVSSSDGVISVKQDFGTGSSTNVQSINQQTARRNLMNKLLGYDAAHENLIKQNYALALESSIATGASLSTAMGISKFTSTQWNAMFPTSPAPTNPTGGTIGTSLMNQLKMIAKIIEAGYRPQNHASGAGMGMKRQIFFCTVGGYDTHSSQTANAGSDTVNNDDVVRGTHANLLAEISQSVNAFQNAMTAIGTAYGDVDFTKRVTSFTASDFSRNFPTNGSGSDHGWGGHHMVVGGAVNGQRTYGKYPTLAVGGPDDTTQGRWIPTTSVDQFAATMAKWFGIPQSEMGRVFPNLNRFNTPDMGFMQPG